MTFNLKIGKVMKKNFKQPNVRRKLFCLSSKKLKNFNI